MEMVFGNNILYQSHLPIREKQTSSFDTNFGGNIGADGNYYILLRDYKTHEEYCVLRGNEIKFDEKYVLTEGEQKIIFGNLVRGMTEEEEILWNQDRLMAIVDCFGNISVNETMDTEYFIEHYL